MPDNIECPDRITRHSEVALTSFVEIADDLPVTSHRLSRTVRDTDGAVYGRGFRLCSLLRHGTHHDSKPLPPFPEIRLPPSTIHFRPQEH